MEADELKEMLYEHYTSWRQRTKNDIHKMYIDMMLDRLLNDKPLSWPEAGVKHYDSVEKKLYWSKTELMNETGWTLNMTDNKIKDGRIICFK